MAIGTTNVKLRDIHFEFGSAASGNYKMSQLYANTVTDISGSVANVPGYTFNNSSVSVPTSGQIAKSNFRGTSYGYTTYSYSIPYNGYFYQVGIDSGNYAYSVGNQGSDAILYILSNIGVPQYRKAYASGSSITFLDCFTLSGGTTYAVGTNLSGTTGYLVSFSSVGAINWQKSVDIGLMGISVDTGTGNIFVAGNDSSNAYIMCFNSSGTLQWQRRVGSTTSLKAMRAAVFALTASSVAVMCRTDSNSGGLYILWYDLSGVLLAFIKVTSATRLLADEYQGQKASAAEGFLNTFSATNSSSTVYYGCYFRLQSGAFQFFRELNHSGGQTYFTRMGLSGTTASISGHSYQSSIGSLAATIFKYNTSGVFSSGLSLNNTYKAGARGRLGYGAVTDGTYAYTSGAGGTSNEGQHITKINISTMATATDLINWSLAYTEADTSSNWSFTTTVSELSDNAGNRTVSTPTNSVSDRSHTNGIIKFS